MKNRKTVVPLALLLLVPIVAMAIAAYSLYDSIASYCARAFIRNRHLNYRHIIW